MSIRSRIRWSVKKRVPRCRTPTLHTLWRKGNKVILLWHWLPRQSGRWPELNLGHMITTRVRIHYATALTSTLQVHWLLLLMVQRDFESFFRVMGGREAIIAGGKGVHNNARIDATCPIMENCRMAIEAAVRDCLLIMHYVKWCCYWDI